MQNAILLYPTPHASPAFTAFKDSSNQRSSKMKVIHVLGAGCPRCLQLKKNAQAAADSTGADCEILEVSDIEEILEFGAMMTPALVVDGELKIQGKIASVEEIAALLK